MAGDRGIMKPTSVTIEDHLDEKNIGSENEGDYSGAVKKTSEEEFKLVRKLDRRIMSALWAMYFLASTNQYPSKTSVS